MTSTCATLRILVLAAVALVATLLVHVAYTSKRAADRRPGRRLETTRTPALLDMLAAAAAELAWDWRVADGGGTCSWHNFTPSGSIHGNASICLRGTADLLADHVRKNGQWAECADLPVMLAAGHGSGVSSVSSAGGTPLFVDVGANVGTCTLHMLLATDADVVAFEPGGDNLKYASQTFLRLADGSDRGDGAVLPEARRRLLLLRAGVGATAFEQSLHQAVGNAGHAVIGVAPKQYAPLGHVPPQRVVVRPLDEMLWPAARRDAGVPPPRIALLKLDVEGYECNALAGMRHLLKAGAIAAFKLEVFDTLLQLQGCSAVALQRTLVRAGYTLHRADNDPRATPTGPALAAERLHATTVGEPYNLWCVYQPGPPSEVDSSAPMPSTLQMAEEADGVVATAAAAPAGRGEWRDRRRGARMMTRSKRNRRLFEHEEAAGANG